MINNKTFSPEHIKNLHSISGADPSLIEKSIHALSLLNNLSETGLPFIFKGGTSLLLLLETPRRLSIDIDIIVDPKDQIEPFLELASTVYPFHKCKEIIRNSKTYIPKKHFKFTYTSALSKQDQTILLDVLFSNNPYPNLLKKDINNSLLLLDENTNTVNTPDISSILGDKLTAFAPHTTGILIGEHKDMEIIKQFFDISTLIDEIWDMATVKKSYLTILEQEQTYRNIHLPWENVLWDTINASICIASRGKMFTNEYQSYLKGIRDLSGHIYNIRFTPEKAVLDASKILYFSACLLKDKRFIKVDDPSEYLNLHFQTDLLKNLKFLKKANPLAYSYAIKADIVLSS